LITEASELATSPTALAAAPPTTLLAGEEDPASTGAAEIGDPVPASEPEAAAAETLGVAELAVAATSPPVLSDAPQPEPPTALAAVEPILTSLGTFAQEIREPDATSSPADATAAVGLPTAPVVVVVEPASPADPDSWPDLVQATGQADVDWTAMEIEPDSVLTALKPLELDPLRA